MQSTGYRNVIVSVCEDSGMPGGLTDQCREREKDRVRLKGKKE